MGNSNVTSRPRKHRLKTPQDFDDLITYLQDTITFFEEGECSLAEAGMRGNLAGKLNAAAVMRHRLGKSFRPTLEADEQGDLSALTQ